MKVTIHQPEHLPWLGFFHKIYMADMYVVLDNVQYRRRYFQNRNKIRTKGGWQWITVPLKKKKRDELTIKEALISTEDLKWKNKNLFSIYHSYHKSDFFDHYWNDFKAIYNQNYTHLIDLNLSLLRFIFKSLGINKDIKLASDLNVAEFKGDLIFTICKTLEADIYISGISGKDYLDIDKFEESRINIIEQEFHHPIYEQLHEPFFPCMSIIDLLFNYGDASLDIINGIGVSVMEEVFE